MIVLGLDLETTGLDNQKDSITEIGAVLYDWKTNTPLEMMNRVITTSDSIPQRIVELTGITDEIIKNHGKDIMSVVNEFNSLASQAEMLVIHNAPFDTGFMKPLEGLGLLGLNKEVIDTMRDLPLNKTIHQSVKLTHLAATHGFLNPFSHRAIFDVLTMLKVLGCYQIEDVLNYKNSPTLKVIANVTFDQKDLAKEAGFRWHAKEKIWFKELKEFELNKEEQDYKFDYDVEKL